MEKVMCFWKSGKQLNIIILSALIYTALLIPFKGIILVPQIVELRIAAFIPVVFGIVLGPAGAVGCALGNLIGDLFGTWTYGSIFGMLGNFLIGFVSYRLWAYSFKKNRHTKLIQSDLLTHFLRFIYTAFVANLSGAILIAIAVETLGYAQFLTTFSAIMTTNMLSAILIGWWIIIPLAYFCEDNAFAWNHEEIMPPYKNWLLREFWWSDPYIAPGLISSSALSIIIALLRGQKIYEVHFNGEMDPFVIINAAFLFAIMLMTLTSGRQVTQDVNYEVPIENTIDTPEVK